MSLFKRIAYIYTGTNNYAADYLFYKNVLGGRLVWEFENFGAKVCAFDLCGEPYLLLADHVPAPGKRLLFEVDDLDVAAKELKSRGWKPDGKKFEVPDGPCYNFKDESGNEYGIIQMTRPHVLEKEFVSDRKKNYELSVLVNTGSRSMNPCLAPLLKPRVYSFN